MILESSIVIGDELKYSLFICHNFSLSPWQLMSKNVLCVSHIFWMHYFCSHVRRSEFTDFSREGSNGFQQSEFDSHGKFNADPQLEENDCSSPESTRSFVDTQLEIFRHQHSMLILHFFSLLMFVPSLVAWSQVLITIFSSLFELQYYINKHLSPILSWTIILLAVSCGL